MTLWYQKNVQRLDWPIWIGMAMYMYLSKKRGVMCGLKVLGIASKDRGRRVGLNGRQLHHVTMY